MVRSHREGMEVVAGYVHTCWLFQVHKVKVLMTRISNRHIFNTKDQRVNNKSSLAMTDSLNFKSIKGS
jgi:hypothetical protein